MQGLGPRFHTAADLDAAALSTVQRRIRSRVLRLAVRHGVLTPEVAADLARWGHGGGFSLHAVVAAPSAVAAGTGYDQFRRPNLRPHEPLGNKVDKIHDPWEASQDAALRNGMTVPPATQRRNPGHDPVPRMPVVRQSRYTACGDGSAKH